MKVLFLVHQFYPKYFSGTEAVTLNIARMTQISGNKVRVVTYDPTYRLDNEQKFGMKVHYSDTFYGTVPVTEFYIENPPHDIDTKIDDEDTLSFARMMLDREKPDVVHATHLMRVNPFLTAAQERGIPCVLTLTDFWTICPRVNMVDKAGNICFGNEKGGICAGRCRDNVNYALRFSKITELLKNAKLVTAPSLYVQRVIENEINLGIEIFSHGIDYTKVPSEHTTCRRHKRIRIGFVGTLIEHKGVENLLSAFSAVKNRQIDLVLYGSGRTEYEQKLKNSIQDDGICWMGACSRAEVMNAYNMMDILVVPSVCCETYSLAKNEALASGVPVIVSNLGALPEQISNGKNGFIFDPAHVDELTDILQKINDNPQILNDLRKNVQMISVPSIEQEAFRYLAVYLDLIGR